MTRSLIWMRKRTARRITCMYIYIYVRKMERTFTEIVLSCIILHIYGASNERRFAKCVRGNPRPKPIRILTALRIAVKTERKKKKKEMPRNEP